MTISKPECIFCKILRREIPSPILYESDTAFVVRDIYPDAKHHLLVIPKSHVDNLEVAFSPVEMGQKVISDLFALGIETARKEGFLSTGFKTLINTHESGGQTVMHLHMHLLAN